MYINLLLNILLQNKNLHNTHNIFQIIAVKQRLIYVYFATIYTNIYVQHTMHISAMYIREGTKK